VTLDHHSPAAGDHRRSDSDVGEIDVRALVDADRDWAGSGTARGCLGIDLRGTPG